MQFDRRRLGATLAALVGLAWTGAHAQPQAWPARQVTLVNNFPPGGPSDILARGVAAVLQEEFKQPFVVDNQAGAIADALQRPEMQARMKGLDLFHEGQTRAAAAKRLADLHARDGQLVRSTGMKAE